MKGRKTCLDGWRVKDLLYFTWRCSDRQGVFWPALMGGCFQCAWVQEEAQNVLILTHHCHLLTSAIILIFWGASETANECSFLPLFTALCGWFHYLDPLWCGREQKQGRIWRIGLWVTHRRLRCFVNLATPLPQNDPTALYYQMNLFGGLLYNPQYHVTMENILTWFELMHLTTVGLFNLLGNVQFTEYKQKIRVYACTKSQLGPLIFFFFLISFL